MHWNPLLDDQLSCHGEKSGRQDRKAIFNSPMFSTSYLIGCLYFFLHTGVSTPTALLRVPPVQLMFGHPMCSHI